jgi:hypothetical protein
VITSALNEAIYQNTVGNSQGYREGLSWNTGKNSVTQAATALSASSKQLANLLPRPLH